MSPGSGVGAAGATGADAAATEPTAAVDAVVVAIETDGDAAAISHPDTPLMQPAARVVTAADASVMSEGGGDSDVARRTVTVWLPARVDAM